MPVFFYTGAVAAGRHVGSCVLPKCWQMSPPACLTLVIKTSCLLSHPEQNPADLIVPFFEIIQASRQTLISKYNPELNLKPLLRWDFFCVEVAAITSRLGEGAGNSTELFMKMFCHFRCLIGPSKTLQLSYIYISPTKNNSSKVKPGERLLLLDWTLLVGGIWIYTIHDRHRCWRGWLWCYSLWEVRLFPRFSLSDLWQLRVSCDVSQIPLPPPQIYTYSRSKFVCLFVFCISFVGFVVSL